MALRRPLLSMLVCVGLVGCGSDGGDGGGSAMQDAGGESTGETDVTVRAKLVRRGPLVKLRESQFGPVLFSGNDRALYLFTRDGKRSNRCYGDCAVAWPPFYARGRPRAARGVDPALLGTVKRRDGRRQVTYKGQPLYFYEHDPKRQVLCNDVVEFGGTWFALDAAGKPPA